MDIVQAAAPMVISENFDVYISRGHCNREKYVRARKTPSMYNQEACCCPDNPSPGLYTFNECFSHCSIMETNASNVSIYVIPKVPDLLVTSVDIGLCDMDGQLVENGLKRKGSNHAHNNLSATFSNNMWIIDKFGISVSSSKLYKKNIASFKDVAGGFMSLKIDIKTSELNISSFLPFFWSVSNVPHRFQEIRTLHLIYKALYNHNSRFPLVLTSVPPFRARIRTDRNGVHFLRTTYYLNISEYVENHATIKSYGILGDNLTMVIHSVFDIKQEKIVMQDIITNFMDLFHTKLHHDCIPSTTNQSNIVTNIDYDDDIFEQTSGDLFEIIMAPEDIRPRILSSSKDNFYHKVAPRRSPSSKVSEIVLESVNNCSSEQERNPAPSFETQSIPESPFGLRLDAHYSWQQNEIGLGGDHLSEYFGPFDEF